METTRTNDGNRDEREPSGQVALYDVPLCPNRLVRAVKAVRGPGAALALICEHLHLRTTANLGFSSYHDGFYLQLSEIDRFQKLVCGPAGSGITHAFQV